jgi:ABC-type branched-subunit amino acid transport system ATPase component
MEPSGLIGGSAVQASSHGLAPEAVGRPCRAVRIVADNGIGALLAEPHARGMLESVDRAYLLHCGQIQCTGTAAEAHANIDQIQAAYVTASAC